MSSNPVEVALAYHDRTKHFPGRYARSLGHLDWATQPDPFRRFEGAERIPLVQVPTENGPSLDDVLNARVEPRALDHESVSQLFYDSLALSAWKEHGKSRWSLRVNPSSGNLHPTEGYLLTGPLAGVDAGVYHYAPYFHALERRRALTEQEWNELARGLPARSILVGLASIHWRESWKYGERAFRYCQHDAGHAIAAIAIAAAALGWRARVLEAIVDDELASVLGIAGQSGIEAEHPDCLLAITSHEAADWDWRPGDEALSSSKSATWVGTPAALSPDHQDWPVIDQVVEAARKLEPLAAEAREGSAPTVRSGPGDARPLVRARRSAVELDGTTRISREAFYRMLDSTLPTSPIPFGALPWKPRVHLALFVHRVDDLEPGLYFLARRADAVANVRAAFRDAFAWELAPERSDLFLLVPADVRHAAELISCHQQIASHGAFALGMIAELEPTLREQGACWYRRLHWEAGAIGQILYLEAEAHGVRATGIGCFFDEVMHELLGAEDRRFQTLYHFTVGGPVEDPRLRTSPPYTHLENP